MRRGARICTIMVMRKYGCSCVQIRITKGDGMTNFLAKSVITFNGQSAEVA